MRECWQEAKKNTDYLKNITAKHITDKQNYIDKSSLFRGKSQVLRNKTFNFYNALATRPTGPCQINLWTRK